MATHSTILTWVISWTEEPGELLSMCKRVGHDLATKQQNYCTILFFLKKDGMHRHREMWETLFQPVNSSCLWMVV